MKTFLMSIGISFFALVLGSLSVANSITDANQPKPVQIDFCDGQGKALAHALVSESSLISFSCKTFSVSKTEGQIFALVSLNNPKEGAETYLVAAEMAVVEGAVKFKQVVLSRLIGGEAFPIRFNGQLELMPVLSPVKSGYVHVATNVLAGPRSTAIQIWDFDAGKMVLKSKDAGNFDAQKKPPSAHRSGRNSWVFK